jgi:DNA (cytosine-5)-methyltransferase 1
MYYTILNSKYWGVPQNRERYFVVGVHESIKKEFVFPEQQTDFVPMLSSVLEDEVDEKYYIDNEKAQKVIEQAKKRVEIKGTHAVLTPDRLEKRQNGRRAKAEEEEMFTLTAQDHHGVIEPKIDVVGMLDIKGQENIRRVYDIEGLAPTLTTSEGGHRQPKIIIAGNLKPDDASRIGTRDNVWDSEGLGGCIMASDYKQPRPVLHNFRVRKLTPREYARLQGFPESYKQVVSDTQFYKQMGNAVTVNVSQAIAEKIKEFLS